MKNKRDEIKSLNDREKSRDKLQIWFGTRGLEGTLHSLREVLANSTDEIYNNYEQGSVAITISDDGKRLSVLDTGRGIPMSGKDSTGKNNYELLFLQLFAGTNYDSSETGKETVGQNGVGNTVLTYTSKYFKATSWSRGKEMTFFTQDGGLTHSYEEKACSKEKHGTLIEWELDPEVYETAVFPIERVQEIVLNQAAMCHSISFTLNGEEFHFTSVEEYSQTFFEDAVGQPIECNTPKIDLYLSTTIDGEGRTFLNRNWLKENGTIHDGVINGTRLFFNKYLRDNVKGSSPLTNADVEQVLSFVCHIRTSSPEFSGQTKLSTASPAYKTEAQAHVQKTLEMEQAKNPANIKKMSEALLEAQKLNGKNSQARARLTKALTAKVDTVNNRIEGLVDCKFPGRPGSEIFFSEGLSAAGSVVSSRNPNMQASFPMKGKIQNVQKLSADKAFQNVELMNIARVLGCGIETKHKEFGAFDINQLRYEKIIIATDADVDGFHIATLLINFFSKFMPELLIQGRVYLALSPLFEIEYRDGTHAYANTIEERDELVAKKPCQKVSFLKGLGEVDAQVMSETTVNPETRRIMQFKASTKKELDSICNKWFGTDVNLRREDIMKNFKEVVE